ncbi:MAG: YcxB family protein [Hyphomicrobiaceae bacterium]|nr:YcxB family protein [Hyphomicrobiaceae bacterium]
MTDTSNAPVYQLRYTLVREDIAAYELMPHELQGAEKLWLFGPILLCGAAVGLFEDQLAPYLPWDPTTKLGQVASVVSAIAIGYALSLILLTARARHRIRTTPLSTSPISLEAYADRIVVKQGAGVQTFPWHDLTVVSGKAHVILAYTPRDAVIIPLRAFTGPDEMRAFADFAEAAGRDADDEIGNKNENKEAP